ncbi:IS200/IS605 family transposase [Rubritalea tangerina]|uniref:IS200/IS605 family transposase n=1 Tax=Rubritalea tangerina TaxID=430798 RepID=A0ABW4ZEY9_9BACT
MSQSLSRIYLHIIFSTKERFPHLTEDVLREETHAYLGGVAKSMGCQPVIVGGVADHVHLLLCFSRTMEVASLVRDLKRRSSVWLHDKGIDKFAWQNGYGVFSVALSNVGEVETYIRNQEEHHRKVGFQEEYGAFLKKHAVQYDERYVWD